MKILIIGSAGFIGSNAAAYFKERNNQVHCADIVLKESADYTIINHESPDFTCLFQNQKYDVCINATGTANVQYSFKNPALDYTLNVSNVYHILEAIHQLNPTCKFINFSSAAVYGNPASLPVSEQAVLRPISPYGWHKLYSEQICREFYEIFKIATANLRVFSAYGPGLKKQIFWDLYQKTKNSRKADIYGTGRESRDFIYIDDILQAIELIIRHGAFDGSAINIANGEEFLIKDLAVSYYQLLSWKGEVTYSGEIKNGDPRNWQADIGTLNALGYRRAFTLESGLKKYILWLQENGL